MNRILILIWLTFAVQAPAFADDIKAAAPVVAPGTSFSGIGATLITSGPLPMINEVLPNGPSAGSGLRAQDTIVRVDYRDLKGLNLTEVVGLIRGESGTSVVITVRHAGETKLHDFTITRGAVKLIR